MIPRIILLLLTLFSFTAITHAGTIQLPQTGQTTSYAAGDDGAVQAGVTLPNPRFTDNSDGTVTDNLTGLVWLKNANCFGSQTWANAITSANNLAFGVCGLSDESSAGQWRLPNINELKSLVDSARYNPALPSGHPYSAVQMGTYWSSSSTSADYKDYYAWYVSMGSGDVFFDDKNSGYYVWPVRAGQ